LNALRAEREVTLIEATDYKLSHGGIRRPVANHDIIKKITKATSLPEKCTIFLGQQVQTTSILRTANARITRSQMGTIRGINKVDNIVQRVTISFGDREITVLTDSTIIILITDFDDRR
jgi:hypothetical protein